jgi:hypothetical protein
VSPHASGPADVLNEPGILVGECDDAKAESLKIALRVIGAHADLIESIEDS